MTAHLNFYVSRICYNDPAPVQNPKQKNFDFYTAREGIQVRSPSANTKDVLPGQTVLLESTARILAANMTTTELEISFPTNGSDIARMRWTGNGTAPAFRVLRAINYGSSPTTTSVTIERLSPTSTKLTFTGAAVDVSAAIVGDDLFFQSNDDSFTSPFSASTVGRRYTILDKTTTTLTVRDDGIMAEETGIVLGADYASVLRVFSSSGVQVGDKIKFNSASAFNTENKIRELEIYELSDRDLYFVAPNAIPEVVVAGVAAPFMIYDRLINFVSIEARGPIKLKLNGGSEEIELQEFVPCSAIFMGTISATMIEAVNSTNETISISIQSCTI